jgi:hypothetical protein
MAILFRNFHTGIRTERQSPNFYARGTFLKVAVDQSLGTGDRKEAEVLLAKIQKDIFERQTHGLVRPSETFASAALRYMACRRGCFAIEMATGITSNAASLAGLIMHVEIVCKLS